VLLALLCLAPAIHAAEPEPPTQLGISIVFDPTNFQQNLLTAIRTAEAIRQRIEMIRHQIEQLRWMLDNIRDLEDPTYRQVAALLALLAREMERRTEGLVYSQRDIDRRFQEIYPHQTPSPDLAGDEERRIHTTIETARAALVGAHELSDSWARSQRTVGEMKDELLDTDGHLEALQSVGLILSWVGEEVSLGTQQQTMTNNLLAVLLAHWLSSQDEAAQTFRKAVDNSRTPRRTYASFEPLPVVPAGYPRRLGGSRR
jgi:P-type conjugative transfer protein TrbJ